MINFVWFTRTENFYAELDALFYFFITARTSSESGSSCEAMPGGLAFPGFLFPQMKFHIPPKSMAFPPPTPAFISRALERLFFRLYFLRGVGVSIFLLKKGMVVKFYSILLREAVSCRSATQAQLVDSLPGQCLPLGWSRRLQAAMQILACPGGPRVTPCPASTPPAPPWCRGASLLEVWLSPKTGRAGAAIPSHATHRGSARCRAVFP